MQLEKAGKKLKPYPEVSLLLFGLVLFLFGKFVLAIVETVIIFC